MDRQKSVEALGCVLKQEKNCQIFEKYIYEKTKLEPEIYVWCIYQVIGLLMQKSSEMKELLGKIKDGKVGWNSPTYEKVSEKIEEFDNYLVKPFEVVEGVVECGKCNSKKTWSVQKQLRGSDEPMTTFSRCVECGHQWSYSG